MLGRFFHVLQGRKSNVHAAIYLLAAVCGSWLLHGAAYGEVHFTPDTPVSGMEFGESIYMLPDINGDGCDELLIGAPLANAPGSESGKVYLRLGGSQLTVLADYTWNGPANGRFGWAIAPIGDVNNDGDADWAVGEPLANNAAENAGRVYIYYGEHYPRATADVIIDGAIGGDQFGFSIAPAGDFNGDGVDDFIVGAPYSDLRGANAGAAYVIYGAEAGPSTDLDDATVLTGQISDDQFGWSVSAAGNFLAGAEACIAVGAPLNNTHGGLDAGAVFVYEGSLFGADPDTSIDFAAGVSHSSKAGSQYGFAVRYAGRWDSDSYDDLAVGAPYCNAGQTDNGRVEIIYGGSNPDPTGDRYVNGEAANDLLGFSLAWGRHISGSSRDDLIIGAPGHNDNAAGSGRAYIYEGGSSSQTSASSLVILAVEPLVPDTEAGDRFGASVASAGDFDNDGEYDVAVAAASGNSASNIVSGYVWLQDSSGGAVAIEDGVEPQPGPEIPAVNGPILSAAAPNPFNPSTTLRFQVPAGRRVDCRVTDLRGRQVRELYSGIGTGDWQAVIWDGCDQTGRTCASGVYLVRLETDDDVRSQRVVLAK